MIVVNKPARGTPESDGPSVRDLSVIAPTRCAIATQFAVIAIWCAQLLVQGTTRAAEAMRGVPHRVYEHHYNQGSTCVEVSGV